MNKVLSPTELAMRARKKYLENVKKAEEAEDAYATNVPVKKFIKIQTLSENGEVITEHTQRIKRKNGGGFVLSYTSKVSELVIRCTMPSALRIFMLIAHKQTYEGGFRTNRKYFSEVLRIDRKTVYNALEWLKDNFIINESRIDGSLEFMVNPEYVTVGTNKEARIKIWNNRWVKLNREKHADLIVE